MQPENAKVEEFFKRNPQVSQVKKGRGPGYWVDGVHIITTEWGLYERRLSESDKVWLVEKNLTESEFLELKKSVREFFYGCKEFDVKRKDS